MANDSRRGASLGRAARLLVLTLAAALLAGGCRTAVLHDLSEQDSNQVIAALQDQGILASKETDNPENGTYKVLVSRGDAARAFSVLQGFRLPNTRGRRIRDVFGSRSLVTTPLEEKALFLEALQGEIAHTLEAMGGVVSARVHVAIPEPDLSGQAPRGVKASVMIEYRADASGRPPVREDEVRRLVASGVNDLTPENVAVVLKPITLVRAQQAYDFVAFGPIVIAAPSVAAFKGLAGGVLLILLFLGGSLYWSGRVVNELRQELAAAQRQTQAIQKTPHPGV